MKENRKIKIRIMTKLMAYFMALIILPLSVLGVFSYRTAEGALKAEAEKALDITLANAQDKMTMEMGKIQDILGLFKERESTINYADGLKNGNVTADAQDIVQRSLAQFHRSTGIAEQIFIIDSTGKILADAPDGKSVGLDVSGRDYFQNSIKGNNYWSDVIISKASGNPVVVYSMPLQNSAGGIQGVIAGAVKFEYLTNVLSQVKAGDTGYAYMLDQTGLVLYHPVKEKIMQENIREVAAGDLKDIVEKMIRGEEGKGTYTYNKIEKLNMYKPVGRWSIAVNIPVEEYMRGANQIQSNTFKIAGITILIGILVAFFAARQIRNPIQHLMGVMAQAEKGDMTIKAVVHTSDEIGDLANSFNAMIEEQRKVIEQVMNSANLVGSSAQQSSSISEEMAASAENQTLSMEDLTRGMHDMSRSITDVAENVSEMAGNINRVNNSITELGKAAEDAARSVEETTSTIVEVTGSIQQMNASIEIVANNSQDASKEGEKTVGIAQEGKTAVENTIQEMDKINQAMGNLTQVIRGLGKAAVQIGDIVEVIDDIAEQTNLLSLNASIEAARAGEHGKGFAVVAGAIGNLAEKSSSATKDITHLIKQIQEEVQNAIETTNNGANQVENGVGLVRHTGVALDKIFVAIENTTKRIHQIANATDEQLKASRSIMDAIERVNQLSSNVSTAVEEQVAAVQEVILAIEKVDTLSQEVASAAEQQSASSQEVLATAESVSHMTNEVSAAGEEVASTAQHLAKEAERLIECVSKFKV